MIDTFADRSGENFRIQIGMADRVQTAQDTLFGGPPVVDDVVEFPIPRNRRRRASDGRQPCNGELLRVEDAADYLGVSPGTLRNWLSERRIAYVKVGRLTRIRRSVLTEFVERNTVTAA